MPKIIYTAGNYDVVVYSDHEFHPRWAGNPSLVHFVIQHHDNQTLVGTFHGTSKSRRWYSWLLYWLAVSVGDETFSLLPIEEAASAAYELANKLAGISSDVQARLREIGDIMKRRESALKELTLDESHTLSSES